MKYEACNGKLLYVMASASENNKRIAKNTLLLYVRMLFMLVVSLYTSRVVLNSLGVEDYGIYNVVGGVVAMFSILSGSLSPAISRFITYELGKKDTSRLNGIFCTSVNIQLILGIFILLLAEIVGGWFLNFKMNISGDRMVAANWVLQFSLFTFFVNLISVPYNATIIAHERMSAFAYISILEVIGKLGIAFMISISPIDRLVFYALLICIVSLIVRLVYSCYCKRHFEECFYHFGIDKKLLKEMLGFAGWNFIGSSSAILRDQGGNILINLFCGPMVNAARGIAFQVNNAVLGFSQNFMMALNPQITKSYASGDYIYMMKLIFQGARFSFYLLLILSLPIFFNTHYILSIWLGMVPEHTVHFVRLALVFTLSEAISNPLITAMQATGKIRDYQLLVGGLQMLNLPISYVLLSMGMMPEIVFVVAIIMSQCCLVARLYMLHKAISLNIVDYLRYVYINVIVVGSLSLIISAVVIPYFRKEELWNFIITTIISCLITIAIVFYIGCSQIERNYFVQKMKKILNRKILLL